MPQAFHSSVLIGLVLAVGVFCALRTFTSWVKGLQLLIVVVLFGGIVGARLGSTPFPIAFRDVAIVLPLYAVFLLTKAGSRALRAVPADLALGLCVFAAWLGICLFNPNGVAALRMLIGLKVWAFYIPFFFVGIALAQRPEALFRVLRALLLCGFVACGVGLLQATLIRLIGYHAAIDLFFGEAGRSVTQGYSAFNVGGGIYRIPGTFSFTSQYVAFLFLFLSAAVIVSNSDPDPRYQRMGRIAFYVGLLAGLFSGTKGAFLMFPLYGLAFAAFGLIRGRLLVAAPIAIAATLWAISLAGLDPLGLASFGAEQAQMYGRGFVFQQVDEAVRHGAFGEGIGSSTSAARFAAIAADPETRLGFESYFAKAAAELGTVGFVVVAALLLIIAVHASLLAVRHWGRDSNRILAPLAIYVVYVIITSLKGAALDTDPTNVFFWLTLGVASAFGRAAERGAVMVGDQSPSSVPKGAGA
ncbi:MAG TPA: hypothetical protein VMU06_01495 [Stellaceae bacterium]|nr:hypothetical protein [Stellaceae bacterium]